MAYIAGRVWAICDRCGFKKDHAELRKEWTQLLVCSRCWDPQPAELSLPKFDPQEGMPVKDPRPRPPDVFLDDGDVTEDSF